ncbi:LytTR family DNA-binding domain-containing protein [Wukongibacter baidiensis]|uniref:LytR/AlgR family response regulator transcription factor n=1 Tax=Wukongibacter baidiensis TaxID=1723361 RepID=UPI003D7F31C8
MMNFIICEDDNRFRKKIGGYIEEYIDRKRVKGQIVLETTLYKEVLEYVNKNSSHKNIYVLDIDLNDDINGLQLAKKIRAQDIYGYVIFLTNHIELSLATYRYKIKALDFIVKNVSDIKTNLYEAFDAAIDETKKIQEISSEERLVIKSGFSTMYLPLCEIVCIETATIAHKLILYTSNRRVEFYGTLKKVRQELDGDFYQIHRSCVINTKYIKRINRERSDMHVLMKNNVKFPLSKKYAKELIERVENIS